MNPGLILDEAPALKSFCLSMDPVASYPLRIDRRGELLPASDQGSTPMCAAYAMAGVIEFIRWKYEGITLQVDAPTIYAKAKELDGIPDQDGTYLHSVVEAAEELQQIPPVDRNRLVYVDTPAELMRAIHRFGVVLIGMEIDAGWGNPQPDGFIQPGGAKWGGHAVLACSYDSSPGGWVGFQNSWGEGHGWRGFNRLKLEDFNKQFRYGLTWEFATKSYF